MMNSTSHHPSTHAHGTKFALFVGALGVVFGDIGTSPLYTLRECFKASGIDVTPVNVLGILAAITWSLILVVTVKYVSIVMRADNRGEGGILALTALAIDQFATPGQRIRVLSIGLLGAALFYGDALITPSISVLSAMEGMELVMPSFTPYVVPAALIILVSLFAFQKYGTEVVGSYFGPVMLVWFTAIGAAGLHQIILNPFVLQALNPVHVLTFAVHHPGLAFLTMGAVVLAVTGAEALYADMGHLGRKPIQSAWLIMVAPALLLNYYGQGGLILAHPETLSNPFFLMVPEMFMLPMAVLATAATIIASQAVISGAFSLTHQAITLGYLPRMEVKHTNMHSVGQIYIPFLNWVMLLGVIILVLGFRSSSNLAAAYGIAVTGTMLLTTMLSATVLAKRNHWHPVLVGIYVGVFFTLDGLFFTANMEKVPHGGWFPLVLGMGIFFLMHTWVKGREASQHIVQRHTPPLETFLERIAANKPPRVPRTAVFMTSDLNHAPPALVYNMTHNVVLHEQVILLKISRARIPRYPASERYSVHHYPHNVTTVQATYGFLERPHVPHILMNDLAHHGLTISHPEAMSYFLSNHTYVPTPLKIMGPLQEPVFIWMDKLAQSAVTFFHLPRRQVIEIGNQIEI